MVAGQSAQQGYSPALSFHAVHVVLQHWPARWFPQATLPDLLRATGLLMLLEHVPVSGWHRMTPEEREQWRMTVAASKAVSLAAHVF